jgi:diguanylate cyclase (GGDEF)-like protein
MLKKDYSVIVFIVFLFIAFPVYYIFNKTDVPTAEHGILDLSSWNFEKDGTVLLNGDWEFYPSQFITPDEFKNGYPVQPAYIHFPATKSEFRKLGLNTDQLYATFRLRVKINTISEKLGIKSFIVLSSYKLFVNDTFMKEVGRVGTNKEDSRPYYLNSQAYFQSDGNTLELIYYACDFHLNDLSIRSPLLGLDHQIERQTNYGLSKDMFLAGSLFIMSLYHFGLYSKRKNDKAPLYFGLLCLLISMRTLVTGERFLDQLLVLPYEVYCKIAYMSAFMGLAAFILYLAHTIKDLLSPISVKITYYIATSLTVITLLTKITFYNLFLNPFFVYLGLMLLYSLVKLLIAYHQKTPYTGFVLVGFLAIGISTINDIVYQSALTSTGSLIPVGVFLFTFTQSYLLASRFSAAFSQAENLTVQNQNILLELTHLNRNLENKVTERTEELNRLMLALESSNRDLKTSMNQLALEVEQHKKTEKEISVAYEQIELMSRTDYLTQLSNRRDIFDQMQKKPGSTSEIYSLVLCDIDHFKVVNDTYGHLAGDSVLVEVANQLKNAVGPEDRVARWGGEEFLILLKNTESNQAFELMERIRNAIEHTIFTENENHFHITMTFGISQFDYKTSFETCIAEADAALYDGKKAGRNQVVLA